MKKRKIRWIVLVAFFVTVGGLFLWQWNNVQALTYLLTLDGAQLEERSKKNEEQFNEVMEKYDLKLYTEEEIQAVIDKHQDIDATVKILVNGEEATQSAETVETAKKDQPISTPVDYTEGIRLQIAKMYVLKSTFVGKLEAIVAQAKEEYTALSLAERTNDIKMKIVTSKTGQIAALEQECDTEVATVVAELQRLLKESGADQSLADKVKTVYAEEKSLKKAYYINELKN